MFVLSLLSYCIQLCSINHCTIILLYYCHHPIIIYYNYNLIPLSSLYNRIILYIYRHYTDYIMTVLIYTYYTIYWLLVIDFIFLLIYNNCIGRMISHGYIMLSEVATTVGLSSKALSCAAQLSDRHLITGGQAWTTAGARSGESHTVSKEIMGYEWG